MAVIQQFTLDELDTMLADHEDATLQFLSDDVLDQHFPGLKDEKPNLSREISEQDAKALRRNMVSIAKQLLASLESNLCAKPGCVSAQEIEIMIRDHEKYWNDRFGRGDVEAENADELSRRIFEIANQLILTLRASNVLSRAKDIFKSPEKALSWLKSPCHALGGKAPEQLLDTAEGFDLVLTTLGRIEHGVFA